MKRLAFLVSILALVAVTASCAQLAVAAATVNGDKISEAEVERELDRVRSDPTFQDLVRRQADQVRGFARRQILSGLIRQQILEQQARNMRIAVRRAQVDRLLSEEAARAGMSVKQFLKQQNLSDDDGRTLAERVVREFELKSRIGQGAGVEAKDVQAFYNQNKAAFEQVHLARITTRSEADARGAVEQLASGDDFATVARARSIDQVARNGGDLGYVPSSSLPTEVQAALAQVEEGTISQPLQASGGFEVYRVLDRRVQPLSAVEGQIRAQIGSQAQDQRFEEWIRDHLAKARIVVNPQYGRFDRTSLQVVANTRRLPD
jgi:parvulin-like peptidyl-prolyl isomerase